ncbi:winged helix-turn-helix domain-containing protein [Acidobacteriota bacterium]
MNDRIGEASGVLWRYLEKNGEISRSALAKGTNLQTAMVERAIGWLAREGKIKIRNSQKPKAELISLTE